jgi:ATP-dependent Clp protease, protease subunit
MQNDKTLNQKVYDSRIIILNGEVNNESATNVIFQMLSMENEDPTKDIFLYINSPGGSVTDGLAIYDTINYLRCDVSTVCYGMAASMGAFLLTCGTKGKRLALPNANILIHQPLIGLGGMQQQTDIEIIAKNMLKTREKLERIFSEKTGKPVEVIHKDIERDNYLTADEALQYGLIDKILTRS